MVAKEEKVYFEWLSTAEIARSTFAVMNVAIEKGHSEPGSHLERGEDGWEQGGTRRGQ